MRLLLIPGFWFSGDLWGEVPELLAAEHELDVDVATLAGQGDGDAEATLDDQLAGLLEIVDEEAGPLVVVGHSAAATLAWLVADRRPERVNGVVLIGGMPATAGSAYAWFAEVVDGAAPFPGWEAFDESEIGDIAPADLERLASEAVAVPAGVAEAPVEYRDERRRDAPTLLVCPEFSPEQAREWIDGGDVPELAAARRLELVDLDAGHWPMVSAPSALAEVLAEFARRVGG